MTCVRRRPRRRGARTRTDLPQREQRSRSERSSKPQWGHVREGTSVIVGGIALTSVDIVTGSCQSPPSWIASTPARSPRAARPRPDAWPTCRPSSTPSGTSTATAPRSWTSPGAYGPWLRARGFARRRRRPRDLERALELREALRALCLANHDVAEAPAALAVLDGDRATPSAPAAALTPSLRTGALEPAGDGPDAACALALAIVFAARADGHLRAAEGVPARPLRLGLLRLLAQPLGPVVLDAHLRQPHQGRGLPAPPSAAPTNS